MEKKIRTELYKMSGIMVVLFGLGIYAHEFVIAGVMAKMALNLSIFALFGVAATIAFRHVLSLRNEVVALNALQVDYGARSKRPKDPFAKPAVVFHEPELLGQGYRLITEELGKQDDLQISNSTVQTLLHDVDQRINDRKSTTLYFSGLMVFLGLLGAFMGLMKTVHSVSDLIGAMDVSGKGGTDSFGKMIEGMKAPLNGMSVGFSSSLFGLMTSMVLGALERCSTSAMKALRNEFEHWLSNMAALESTQSETAGQARPSAEFAAVRKVLEAGAAELTELRGAVIDNARGAAQTRADLDRLTEAVSGLTRAVQQLSDPSPMLQPISLAVADLARNQMDMLSQFRALYTEAATDRAQIRSTLNALGSLVERTSMLDGAELHRQLDRMIVLQGELVETTPAALEALQAAPAQAAAAPRNGLFGWFGGRGEGGGKPLREARALRRELRDSLAANRRVLRQVGQGIEQRLERLEANTLEEQDIVARLEAKASDHQAALESLAATLEAPQDVPVIDGARPYTGARAAMLSLRQRLGAAFDGRDAPRATAADRPPAERRTGTTGMGDL
ncbi:hypothetical protein ACFOON_12400 [Novosphingobium piscinae]|uniref:MotA/TolQ/ExbB proton channel domain-containing protein n=1 Tax=Novosphingobium piscinae TaxID=1507448 RepID=A0A7X1FVX9_9SPHN|nr:hypothetical protein [Novosphingobium piscinae]MBC2667983.1 hypothetical protein [Novosphingobium piscinae]